MFSCIRNVALHSVVFVKANKVARAKHTNEALQLRFRVCYKKKDINFLSWIFCQTLLDSKLICPEYIFCSDAFELQFYERAGFRAELELLTKLSYLSMIPLIFTVLCK